MSEDKPENGDGQDNSPDSGSDEEGISDDQLPPDLQPDEDNPLARHPEQTGDEDDKIGSDREGDPETAPMDEEDADYGGAGSGDSGDDGS